MKKIAPDLHHKLEGQKDSLFDLIVRVSGPVEDGRSRLETRGIKVRRQFKLLSALAVKCRGGEALALADEPWVLQVEEDMPMKTMPPVNGQLHST